MAQRSETIVGVVGGEVREGLFLLSCAAETASFFLLFIFIFLFPSKEI